MTEEEVAGHAPGVGVCGDVVLDRGDPRGIPVLGLVLLGRLLGNQTF